MWRPVPHSPSSPAWPPACSAPGTRAHYGNTVVDRTGSVLLPAPPVGSGQVRLDQGLLCYKLSVHDITVVQQYSTVYTYTCTHVHSPFGHRSASVVWRCVRRSYGRGRVCDGQGGGRDLLLPPPTLPARPRGPACL